MIFFFSSQSLVHIGHYKLKCILWVVSAALAPTLISQGAPEEKARKAALRDFSLRCLASGEAGEEEVGRVLLGKEAKGLFPLNPAYAVACSSDVETKCFHSFSSSPPPSFLSILWRLSHPSWLCPAGTCHLNPACVFQWWLLSAVRDLGKHPPTLWGRRAGGSGTGPCSLDPAGTSSPSWGWTKYRSQAGL